MVDEPEGNSGQLSTDLLRLRTELTAIAGMATLMIKRRETIDVTTLLEFAEEVNLKAKISLDIVRNLHLSET